MVRKAFSTMLIGAIALWGFGFESCLSAQEKPLHIYGPQGPFAPMKECAELFFRVHGVKIEVLTGAGSTWTTRAKEDADIIYEETEYQLSHFMTRHP